MMRLSNYPIPEPADPYFGTNMRNLQKFLDHNANVADKENAIGSLSAAEFEQILLNNLDRTQLKEELTNRCFAVQLSNHCRIRLLTDMYQQRQSKVLLQNLPSSPVVQQIEEMSEFEVSLDYPRTLPLREHTVLMFRLLKMDF
ncbi:unnamed protein product [Echinostoma caproni]|uniref:DNA replication complex GINS protein SLD5 n=1 Tax=Echinostoma caproni TaxID=27848 RepID=A0A183ATH1_9TREM|nr:unnamed protein product [Echinostoma caproni]